MNGLKERKRSHRSVDGCKIDCTVSGSEDQKIIHDMGNSRSVSQQSLHFHRERLQETVVSESNLVYGSSRLNMATYSDHRDSEYDPAYLASTESDDGTTDSSDDSCKSEIHKTVTRRRCKLTENEIRCKKEINCHTIEEPPKICEVGKYMAAREMTPFQEQMNALTVLPSLCYCFMVLLSGSWLSKDFIVAYARNMKNDTEFDDSKCITSYWLPHVHALPPLPLLVALIGILSHAPFSIIYHWKYAHRLPPGLARTTHWSRRMDQAMIHLQSASFSYATTGRLDFFLVNVLFNMDCFYRLFLEKVRPRRNQIRVGISIAAYTLPLLTRGEFITFSKLIVLFAIAGWLFSQYPIGGWSHCVFHIVCTFVPPIMIATALDLSSSQSQLKMAAHCSILAENT